jgi:hypothetical protein
MTIRELSDYLLELLDNNSDIDDSEVVIYSEKDISKYVHYAEMGYEIDDNLITEYSLSSFNGNEEDLTPCLILYDTPVEFDVEEEKVSLKSLLGLK